VNRKDYEKAGQILVRINDVKNHINELNRHEMDITYLDGHVKYDMCEYLTNMTFLKIRELVITDLNQTVIRLEKEFEDL